MADSMALVKTYEVDGEEVRLTPNVVASLVVDKSAGLPLSEIYKFMSICAARKLNPFTGDVYLMPHRGKDGEVKGTVIVSKETFTKRAQRNPRFRGMEAGVTVIDRNGNIERRPGSMVGGQTEKLIGGWAKVYVDGWTTPAYEEVALSEYTTGKSMWASKPATMIRKVALVHALREAFPDEFAGLYDSTEMGTEEPQAPVQANVEEVAEPAALSAPAPSQTPTEPEFEEYETPEYEQERYERF